MPPIIQVENLGKKYTLRHQGAGGGYRRLSEELLEAIKRPFRRASKRTAANGHAPAKLNGYAPAAIDGQPAHNSPRPDAGEGLEARGDGNSREDFWALREVSFDVKQGEVLGIIGRNGAGKSTLLKILSRITEPTEGRVRIKGRVASLLEVGTGFHPELTGRENVFLNGAILGMSRAEIRTRFDEIVAFAEIDQFLDTPVKRYSSGMYVRLAFSVAAHLEPEILVIDEVLAVGDYAFQTKCIGKMSSVAKSGRTILFVSHDMAAVQNLCERCVLLERGRLVIDGTPERVAGAYCHAVSGITRVPVAERIDRRGTGTSRLIDIRSMNDAGKEVTRIGMGEDWTIDLVYQCSKPIVSPHVGFAIATLTGQRATRVLTSETYGDLPPMSGLVRLRCRLQNVNLVPGQYQITCEISDNCVEVIDRIELAMILEVVPRNVLGLGKTSDTRTSLCYFPARWSIHLETDHVATNSKPRLCKADL